MYQRHSCACKQWIGEHCCEQQLQILKLGLFCFCLLESEHRTEAPWTVLAKSTFTSGRRSRRRSRTAGRRRQLVLGRFKASEISSSYWYLATACCQLGHLNSSHTKHVKACSYHDERARLLLHSRSSPMHLPRQREKTLDQSSLVLLSRAFSCLKPEAATQELDLHDWLEFESYLALASRRSPYLLQMVLTLLCLWLVCAS